MGVPQHLQDVQRLQTPPITPTTLTPPARSLVGQETGTRLSPQPEDTRLRLHPLAGDILLRLRPLPEDTLVRLRLPDLYTIRIQLKTHLRWQAL